MAFVISIYLYPRDLDEKNVSQSPKPNRLDVFSGDLPASILLIQFKHNERVCHVSSGNGSRARAGNNRWTRLA